MKSGIIERIILVKDRILANLETIQSTQQALQVQLAEESRATLVVSDSLQKNTELVRTNGEQLAKEITELQRELTRSLSDYSKNIERQLAASASSLKDINDLLIDYCLPTLDPYSFSAAASDYRLKNPEIALLQYLRSFIQSRNAIDIGANKGDVSELLLSAGYKVYAFEPCGEAFKDLSERFEGNGDFKAFPIAIAAEDGITPLRMVSVSPSASHLFDANLTVYASLVEHPMPAEMQVTSAVDVQVRSLKSLHHARQVPLEVGVIKIDTEGGDLDVIRGMGNGYYACVMAEFWDGRHYFSGNSAGLLFNTVQEMRRRGYGWHIVIYRIYDGEGSTEPRFFANIDQSVEYSWGNVVFFKEHALFSEALKWCSANMRQNETFR